MINKDYLKKFFFVMACFAGFKIIENFSFFFGKFSMIANILMPFIWGLGFAYVLNPLMMLIEKRFKTPKRLVSLLIVYFLFFGLIAIILVYVIPVIGESLLDLYNRSTEYFKQLESYLSAMPNLDAVLHWVDIEGMFINNKNEIMKNILNISNVTINSLLSATLTFTSCFFNFVLGVFVSIYYLYDKESLIDYMKKVFTVMLKKEKSVPVLNYFSKVNRYFYSFLIGKMIDSTIIGILCFIGLSILKVRYVLLLSIIIGTLNMIPYFGPFIGAVPAIIVTLFYSPVQALWVAIFVFGLQQFDGWYLGPAILGNTVGVSPLFIIFSILIGGGLFGPIGMLLAVPFLKSLFTLWDDFLNKKIDQKAS